MKVTIETMTENPIDLIYKHYRMCYAPNADKLELKKHETIEAKSKFIIPLMASGHGSPLESVQITFRVEGVSRSLLSQITRHRAGVSFNVQSQRYVDAKNFGFVTPDVSYIQDKKKREQVKTCFENTATLLAETYQSFLEVGVKKEDARAILPMNTSCNFYVTFNLRSLRHFLGLRLCVHAQKEIRELAAEMLKLVTKEIPFAGYKVMNCGRTCSECLS